MNVGHVAEQANQLGGGRDQQAVSVGQNPVSWRYREQRHAKECCCRACQHVNSRSAGDPSVHALMSFIHIVMGMNIPPWKLSYKHQCRVCRGCTTAPRSTSCHRSYPERPPWRRQTHRPSRRAARSRLFHQHLATRGLQLMSRESAQVMEPTEEIEPASGEGVEPAASPAAPMPAEAPADASLPGAQLIHQQW